MSMEQSPCWETNSRSASQKILHFLYSQGIVPKATKIPKLYHYRISTDSTSIRCCQCFWNLIPDDMAILNKLYFTGRLDSMSVGMLIAKIVEYAESPCISHEQLLHSLQVGV